MEVVYYPDRIFTSQTTGQHMRTLVKQTCCLHLWYVLHLWNGTCSLSASKPCGVQNGSSNRKYNLLWKLMHRKWNHSRRKKTNYPSSWIQTSFNWEKQSERGGKKVNCVFHLYLLWSFGQEIVWESAVVSGAAALGIRHFLYEPSWDLLSKTN